MSIKIKKDTVIFSNFKYKSKELVKFLESRQEDNYEIEIAKIINIGLKAIEFASTSENIDFVKLEVERIITNLDSNTTKLSQEYEKFFGEDGEYINLMKSEDKNPFNPLFEKYFSLVDKNMPLVVLKEDIKTQIDQLQKIIKGNYDTFLEKVGAKKEAEKGTQKGFEFEEIAHERLAPLCAIYNDEIKFTGTDTGTGTSGKKGDILITIQTGAGPKHIVIEAKDYSCIKATGKKGLVKYLEDAISQRNAEFGIACSKNIGSITGLKSNHGNGSFVLFGNRLLCEYGDDGFALELAYRYARIQVLHYVNVELEGENVIDENLIKSLLNDIEKEASNLSALKTKVSKIKNISQNLTESLDDLNTDIKDRRKKLLSKLLDISDSLTST